MARSAATPNHTTRVLLRLGDERMREETRHALTRDGHVVLACRGTTPGLGAPGVVVADWPCTGTDGTSWDADDGVPLIAIVADRDAADRALAGGATDCVLRPASPSEVCMRVAAVLHRAAEASAQADAGGVSGVGDLMDALPAGVAVLGPDGGVSQVNGALCRLLDRPRGALLGLNAARGGLLGDDLARVEDMFRRARARGVASGDIVVTVAGRPAPLAVSVTATRDDTGTVSAYLVTVRRPSDRESIEEALGRVARAAAAGTEDVFAVLVQEAMGLVEGRGAALVRTTEAGPVVVATAGVAPPLADAAAAGGAPTSRAARPGLGGRSRVVSTPLRVAGHLWGRLVVELDSGDPARGEKRLARYAQVAAIAASDVDARAVGVTVDHDPLTGLLSHSGFFAHLARELTVAHRDRRSLCVVAVDLDHFTRVNDRFGHPAGDRVVRAVADRLRAVARPGDAVGRIGGEEFAWVLPDTDMAAALRLARRARAAVGDTPYLDVGVVTGSFGVAQCGDGTAGRETPEDLHRQAEVALHWAKITGRDRCAAYSFDVAENVFARQSAATAETPNVRAMRALAWAVDARDPHTHRHSARVADLAVQIAAALGWTVERATQLREAGLVHDVGKIAVPDRILFKPGYLTTEEFEEVKRHPAVGAQIVADVLSAEQARWVRSHHERWDGGGYPDGLAGAEIPEEARVLALADAWDVIVSRRSYKEPLSVDDALVEMRRCSGTQFWPDAVDALVRLVEAGAVVGAIDVDDDDPQPTDTGPGVPARGAATAHGLAA